MSRLRSIAFVRVPHACLAALVVIAAGSRVHAQQPGGKECDVWLDMPLIDVADVAAMRLRTQQLQGTVPLTALTIRRPSIERRHATGCAPAESWRIALLPVRARAIYNSTYPLDVNNGAMWAGRGINAAVSAGVELEIGPFSAALYPEFVHQENRAFPLAEVATSLSEFRYAGHQIDWPQRHGDASFSSVEPGQSYARVEAYGVTVGVSTENLWLGPALRTPLLMGSSAPGFPHIFLGTAGPRDIYIGALDMQLFWGRLSESDYFDADSTNDRTLLAGMAVVFEPAFARGLFLGLNRSFLAPIVDGTSFTDYLIDPYTDVHENTRGENQLVSVYARWVHPGVGFEAYAEVGKEDGWGDLYDLVREPEHGQVYLLGFQKTGRFRGASLRWFGELAHLQAAQTLRGGRGVVTLYTHSGLAQGYTHRGQLLGAWIGPGSDAQTLGVERSDERRTTVLALERVRFDSDAYYNQWARFFGQNGHDLALGASLRHVERIGPLSIHGGIAWARRHNRNFVRLDEEAPNQFSSEDNTQLELEARWTPRLRR